MVLPNPVADVPVFVLFGMRVCRAERVSTWHPDVQADVVSSSLQLNNQSRCTAVHYCALDVQAHITYAKPNVS